MDIKMSEPSNRSGRVSAGGGAGAGAAAISFAFAISIGAGAAWPATPDTDAAAATQAAVPRYEHIFLIIEENKSYGQILGEHSIAPNLNRLAREYGQASEFYAEVHPSEGNYVAMLGGDTFGIHDDDAFYCKPKTHDTWCSKSSSSGYADHTITAPSLAEQLEAQKLTWKAYLESIPEPGSDAVRWPTQDQPVKGVPAEIYAVKHNGFMNFKRVQDDPHRAQKIVGFDALKRDLASGTMPNYAHIVPNQCNDMHGRDEGPYIDEDCRKSNVDGLIKRGDRVVGALVDEIMHASVWSGAGNVAIVITFDENGKDERDSRAQGCCGYDPASRANFGGGRIPTIVITNHGVRGVVDSTPYNHYSLLRTTETAFGLRAYLAHAGDSAAGVVDMWPLFKVP
jgi:phospholipase C